MIVDSITRSQEVKMKIGDLVRWIDNDWLGIVLRFEPNNVKEYVYCLLVHDSTTCVFVKDELEVVSCK